MISQQALVSIVIPVYNGSNYLKDAIDSALAQTYKNIEVIVVNDGSTDDGKTETLALSYGDRIRYYAKENGGVSSAINFGIRQMKGEYFSWLSHDDKYIDTKVEMQIKKLQYGGDIAVCSERQINKDGEYLTAARDYTRLEQCGLINWQDEMDWILREQLFSGCALLIPKYVFEAVGFFDEDLRYNQDFDMWLKMCFEKFSWVYHNDVGVLSRVHQAQVTQTRKDLFYRDSYKLGERLIPQLAQVSDKKYNYLYLYAKHCAKYALSKSLIECKKLARENAKFSFTQKIKLKTTQLYGKIRPAIRRFYYRVFKRVKTN